MDRQQLPRLVDRHEFELAAADRAETRCRGDQHPRALLARRRAFRLGDLDEGRNRRGVEEGAEAIGVRGHGRLAASAFSRSTAISTRSGVAGASRRGQIL
jgi:hypothetical protein